jgi:IPT/TIG domain
MPGFLSGVSLTANALIPSKAAGLDPAATPIASASAAADPSFTEQLVVALLITIAVFIVVALIRRYAAARSTGCSFAESALFAVHAGKGAATNQHPTVPPVRGLLVGTDNRTSTSKFNAVLWTAVLVYFLVALSLIFGLQGSKYTSLIHSISPLYLVLLGGPFAAAVLAKGIMSSAVAAGTAQKSRADTPRVADIFSDDDGNTDLVDTQYIIFNLLVAAIVVVQFVHAPGSGAPQIPDFLAILTGASATTYVANKGITTGNNPPVIDRVVPASARAGSHVAILGSNLLAQGDPGSPAVYVDGIQADADVGATPGKVTLVLPPGLATGACTVAVRTPSGAETTVSDKLTVIPDDLTVTDVNPMTTAPNTRLTLTGSGFFAPGDLTYDKKPVKDATPATVYLVSTHAAGAAVTPRECPLAQPSVTDRQLVVTVPEDLVQLDGAGTFGLRLERGGRAFPQPQQITVR